MTGSWAHLNLTMQKGTCWWWVKLKHQPFGKPSSMNNWSCLRVKYVLLTANYGAMPLQTQSDVLQKNLGWCKQSSEICCFAIILGLWCPEHFSLLLTIHAKAVVWRENFHIFCDVTEVFVFRLNCTSFIFKSRNWATFISTLWMLQCQQLRKIYIYIYNTPTFFCWLHSWKMYILLH